MDNNLSSGPKAIAERGCLEDRKLTAKTRRTVLSWSCRSSCCFLLCLSLCLTKGNYRGDMKDSKKKKFLFLHKTTLTEFSSSNDGRELLQEFNNTHGTTRIWMVHSNSLMYVWRVSSTIISLSPFSYLNHLTVC